MAMPHVRQESGFTLVELLVASVCTTIVLGGAVALTSQIQGGYRRQLENSAGEQEARYALDWINRYLRGAGNNPFDAEPSDCLGADPEFVPGGIIMNPDGNALTADITIQSDNNPPDGLMGGVFPDCDQTNEQVTISYDDDTNTITFLDQAVGEATTRTDAVIGGLEFVYLGPDRLPTADPTNIWYVQTRITIRPRSLSEAGLNPRVLQSEVRVRER